MVTGAVKQGVNPSPVRRSSQSVPRAGGVQQSSYDDRPEDALHRLVVQPVHAQHTQRVLCLRTLCRQFRDVRRNCTRSPAIAEGPRDAGVPVEIW